MKLVNVNLLRHNLKEALEGVVDATVDLKFVAIDAKMSFRNEMTASGSTLIETSETNTLS